MCCQETDNTKDIKEVYIEFPNEFGNGVVENLCRVQQSWGHYCGIRGKNLRWASSYKQTQQGVHESHQYIYEKLFFRIFIFLNIFFILIEIHPSLCKIYCIPVFFSTHCRTSDRNQNKVSKLESSI